MISRIILTVRSHYHAFFAHRLSTLRAKVCVGISTVFWVLGGFLYNNHNAPPWIAVLLILIGGVSAAFSARQVVINFKKHDQMAGPCFWTIVSLFVCFTFV